jgi:hypothetical protein
MKYTEDGVDLKQKLYELSFSAFLLIYIFLLRIQKISCLNLLIISIIEHENQG